MRSTGFCTPQFTPSQFDGLLHTFCVELTLSLIKGGHFYNKRRIPHKSLLLRNQFDRTGAFEIPVIRKDEVELENLSLVGYDKVSSGKSDQVVHFFLDDYKFEALWNNPEPRIEKLSAFRAVLSPQFSIYSEMPLAVQIHNTFRSRWCGAYLQSKGIQVVPSVVWGEADTFWFCFDGIEKGSIVAVSTVGVRNKKGHIPDTPKNRDLLQETCNDEHNYLGTDKNGNRWYAQILPDGSQV